MQCLFQEPHSHLAVISQATKNNITSGKLNSNEGFFCLSQIQEVNTMSSVVYLDNSII